MKKISVTADRVQMRVCKRFKGSREGCHLEALGSMSCSLSDKKCIVYVSCSVCAFICVRYHLQWIDTCIS